MRDEKWVAGCIAGCFVSHFVLQWSKTTATITIIMKKQIQILVNCIAYKNKNQSIYCCCCCFKLSDDISKNRAQALL